MSRKSKLILATAVFGAALFAASCGGGGGGTTAGTGNGSTGNGSSGGGGGGGNATSNATASVEAKVLALLEVNGSKLVSICKLKNDTKVECEDDISSGANVTLSYVHEFENGNVVLRDSNNKLYFFDGNQVKKLTTYKGLGSTDETSTSAGITALTGANVKWYATPNFVIMHDSNSNNLVAVSKDGKVIKDTGVTSVDSVCEIATTSSATYKLKADGTSSTTTIPTDLKASAGGKYVVKVQDVNNYKVYLTSDKCSTNGAVDVATLGSNPDDAKMVLAGDGNFYIAVRTGTSLNYYKVSGSTPSGITLSSAPTLYASDKYSYALDGEGLLYAINGSSTYPVLVYRTNGSMLGSVDVAPANYTKLLGFKDRVLAKDNRTTSDPYDIYYNGSVVVNSTVNTISQAPLIACTDSTNTKAIDGEGTNFIRCAFDGGSGSRYLYSLKYSDGPYFADSKDLSTAINNVKFVRDKALVDSGGVWLCTTTDAPSISCNDTGAPDFDTTLLRDGNTDKYLKSNGKDNVLYTSGSDVKAGYIFGPPDKVQYLLTTNVSGGSASFDLTKFAFIPGSGSCLTSIAYLSSSTAFPKAYTIEQPSGACVKGILKVFPSP